MSAALKSRLAWAWCVYIVLSQTGTAGRLADELFNSLFGAGNGGDETLHFVLQKGYHVFLFGVFGWLLTLPRGWRSRRECVLWCLGVGAAGESLQLLALGRSPKVSDAILNVAAGFLAVWVSRRIQAAEAAEQPRAVA